MLYQNLNFGKQDSKNIWYFYCVILGQLEKVGCRADTDFGRGGVYNGHQHVSVCFSEKLFWASQVVPIKPFTTASKAVSLGVPNKGKCCKVQWVLRYLRWLKGVGWVLIWVADSDLNAWAVLMMKSETLQELCGCMDFVMCCFITLGAALLEAVLLPFKPQFCVPANHPSGRGMRTWC